VRNRLRPKIPLQGAYPERPISIERGDGDAKWLKVRPPKGFFCRSLKTQRRLGEIDEAGWDAWFYATRCRSDRTIRLDAWAERL